MDLGNQTFVEKSAGSVPQPIRASFELTYADFLEAVTGKPPSARTKSDMIKPYAGWLFAIGMLVVVVLLSQIAAENEYDEPGPSAQFTIQAKWFLGLAPTGIFILFLSFGFNLLGDALRDTLDPRLRGQP